LVQGRAESRGTDRLGGRPVGELDADLVPGVLGAVFQRCEPGGLVGLHGVIEVGRVQGVAGRGGGQVGARENRQHSGGEFGGRGGGHVISRHASHPVCGGVVCHVVSSARPTPALPVSSPASSV
jgi:hypothetical protein